MFDDVPLSTGQLSVLVLIVAVAASAAVAPMLLMPDNAKPADGTEPSATPTATPSQGTVQDFDDGQMAAVPDSHIRQLSTRETETPPEPTNVRASAGSQTMQVETTVVDGEPALVLSDDRTHDGRWVSVSTKWLQEVHGAVPSTVTIEHESGDTYMSDLEVRDDSAAFYVRGFSTNTVTFSGQVEINADPANDGSQYSYDISDADSTSNVTVNLTGVLNEEWDNVSASGVGDGGTVAVNPAGSSIAGPSANNEPTITFTGVGDVSEESAVSEIGDGTVDGDGLLAGDGGENNAIKSSYEIVPSESGNLTNISVHITGINGGSYGESVAVYIAEGDADTTSFTDGTKVATWDPEWATGKQYINFDQEYSVTSGQTYEVQFVTSGSDGDGTFDSLSIRTDSSATTNRSTTSWNNDYTYEKIGDITYNLKKPTQSPAADIDGDGTNEVSYSGELSVGETVTYEISSLDTSDDTTTVSVTNSVDVSIKLKEQTQTQDPGVELNNGNWANHTGTLADGETVSLTIDKSHIQQGTNTVNVSVADGSLSADAPTMQVQLNYSHDAKDKQTVDYTAGEWVERYNVSKSYASDRQDATLTIPFESNSVAISGVEMRTNGSAWSTPTYTLDGTTLTVELGNVSAGSTIDVRANSTAVEAVNGEVTVTKVTKPGEPLNSTIRVDSTSGELRLKTANSQLHYLDADGTTWTPDEFMIYDQQDRGHRLHMPNAAAGESAKVKALPVEISAKTNAVKVEANSTNTSQPSFDVSPSSGQSDTVYYTYTNAATDEEWILYSQTDDVVRDSGVANSPVKLIDDDSTETLIIMLQSNVDGGGGDSGSSSGGAGPMASTGGLLDGLPGSSNLWLLLGLVAAAGGGWIVLRRAGLDDEAEGTAEAVGTRAGQGLDRVWMAATGNPSVTAALGVIGALGAVWTGLVPQQVAIVAVLAGVPVINYLVLQRLDSFNPVVWGGSTAIAAGLGVELIAEGTVIRVINAAEPILPLVVIIGGGGSLYLIREYLQTRQQDAETPDEVNRIVINDDSGGGDD